MMSEQFGVDNHSCKVREIKCVLLYGITATLISPTQATEFIEWLRKKDHIDKESFEEKVFELRCRVNKRCFEIRDLSKEMIMEVISKIDRAELANPKNGCSNLILKRTKSVALLKALILMAHRYKLSAIQLTKLRNEQILTIDGEPRLISRERWGKQSPYELKDEYRSFVGNWLRLQSYEDEGAYFFSPFLSTAEQGKSPLVCSGYYEQIVRSVLLKLSKRSEDYKAPFLSRFEEKESVELVRLPQVTVLRNYLAIVR